MPRSQLKTGADVTVFFVWFLLGNPSVRAWLRLRLDPARRRPMPPPPDLLGGLDRNIDRFVMPCPEARAELATKLEEVERANREMALPLHPSDQALLDDVVAHADAGAVEQILRSDWRARLWLEYVVDSEAPDSRYLPPPDLVAFADAVDVIRAHPDGRAMLRATLERVDRLRQADMLATYWFAASLPSSASTSGEGPLSRLPWGTGPRTRIQLKHKLDGMVLLLALFMAKPDVRAWLRLLVNHRERQSLPPPPALIPLIVGDVRRLLEVYPEKRAVLVDVLEQAERCHDGAEALHLPADKKAHLPEVTASPDTAAAVEQLLQSDPAAPAWLRRVVETEAGAPLPAPPANLGYFAEAVDVIRAHPDGRAMLRAVVECAEQENHVDVIARHEAAPSPTPFTVKEAPALHAGVERACQIHGFVVLEAVNAGSSSIASNDDASGCDDFAAPRVPCNASLLAGDQAPAPTILERRHEMRASGPRPSRRKLVPRTLGMAPDLVANHCPPRVERGTMSEMVAFRDS